jgi:hypothetical protein
MDDREILEWAALAAGITDGVHCEMIGGDPALYSRHANLGIWSPLTDDGDALRLAVKLGIRIEQWLDKPLGIAGKVEFGEGDVIFISDGDRYAATRRSITCAAAAIGEQKGKGM